MIIVILHIGFVYLLYLGLGPALFPNSLWCNSIIHLSFYIIIATCARLVQEIDGSGVLHVIFVILNEVTLLQSCVDQGNPPQNFKSG